MKLSDFSSSSLATPSSNLDVIRNRRIIEILLNDPVKFRKSAQLSFEQFLRKGDTRLGFESVKQFFDRLRRNLSLPPMKDVYLRAIFEKYGGDYDEESMSLRDFQRMYKNMLYRIRDKFYPPKIEVIRSTLFVPVSSFKQRADIQKQVKFIRRIGSGCFGEVHLVLDLRLNIHRACKIINKSKLAAPIEQVDVEIQIMKSVNHPNVIQIYEIFEDPHNVYILQEYCRGGEILTTLMLDKGKAKINDEKYVRRVMREVFEGLCHIHAKKIVHKDLKPENILFADNTPNSPVKIIDFGLAEIFRTSDTETTVLRGSVIYMAPEAFRDGVLCLKSDVWSAGCIMFNLLTGKFPFDANTQQELADMILTEELDFEHSCGHVSQEARDILKWLLQKDAESRCSAKQALNHPWFVADSCRLSKLNLTQSICLNMKNFSRQNGLRNLFVNMMAHQLSISNENVLKISALFKQLDQENTGMLRPVQLKNALLDANFVDWEANLIIQQLDVKGDGLISYREFLAACFSWQESEMNLLWTAFRRLPADGSGRVSCRDLKHLLCRGNGSRENSSRRGLSCPDENEDENKNEIDGGNQETQAVKSALYRKYDDLTIDRMIKEIDADGDGYIDWSEYEAYMRLGHHSDNVRGTVRNPRNRMTVESLAFTTNL